jgi:hypothetical protein
MTVFAAGVVTLVGALAIFPVTIWLIARTRPTAPAESVAAGLYNIRGRYFFVLMVALVVMLGVTPSTLPYRSMVSVDPE